MFSFSNDNSIVRVIIVTSLVGGREDSPVKTHLFLALNLDHFGIVNDDFHGSKAKILEREPNRVRDILPMLLALNHSAVVWLMVRSSFPAIRDKGI